MCLCKSYLNFHLLEWHKSKGLYVVPIRFEAKTYRNILSRQFQEEVIYGLFCIGQYSLRQFHIILYKNALILIWRDPCVSDEVLKKIEKHIKSVLK